MDYNGKFNLLAECVSLLYIFPALYILVWDTEYLINYHNFITGISIYFLQQSKAFKKKSHI